jgi:hypothetical protein
VRKIELKSEDFCTEQNRFKDETIKKINLYNKSYNKIYFIIENPKVVGDKFAKALIKTNIKNKIYGIEAPGWICVLLLKTCEFENLKKLIIYNGGVSQILSKTLTLPQTLKFISFQGTGFYMSSLPKSLKKLYIRDASLYEINFYRLENLETLKLINCTRLGNCDTKSFPLPTKIKDLTINNCRQGGIEFELSKITNLKNLRTITFIEYDNLWDGLYACDPSNYNEKIKDTYSIKHLRQNLPKHVKIIGHGSEEII